MWEGLDSQEEIVEHSLSVLYKGDLHITKILLWWQRWNITPWPSLQENLPQSMELTIPPRNFKISFIPLTLFLEITKTNI